MIVEGQRSCQCDVVQERILFPCKVNGYHSIVSTANVVGTIRIRWMSLRRKRQPINLGDGILWLGGRSL